MDSKSQKEQSMLPVSIGVAGDVLAKTNGKFFSVTFIKRTDGSKRKMLCRTGVKKYTNGEGLKYSPNDKGLIPVYSLHDKGYRSIPINGIVSFTAYGTEFFCPANA
tara:strand:+ start:609 stop:926 length:318 start_codon:yes stop_codon:yes gene_type:complete